MGQCAAVFAAINSKPPWFFPNAVCHINLGWFTSFSRRQGLALLRLCPNIESLAVLSPFIDPALLQILMSLQPYRLSISLHGFFHAGSTFDICFTHPLFARLTHLLIMDSDIFTDISPALLAELPALIYLGLAEYIRWDTMRQLLNVCPKLVVLANLRSLKGHEYTQKLIANMPISDARFVVIVYKDLGILWDESTSGGWDFWSEAKTLVEKRRHNELTGTYVTSSWWAMR
jgi:hypothetical protein